jgi:capsular exopolysaccharide synthesis family protein
MSKYFNETLRARHLKPSDELLKAALDEESGEEPIVAPLVEQTISVVDTLSNAAVPLVEPTMSLMESEPDGSATSGTRRVELLRTKLQHIQFNNLQSVEAAEEAYRGLRTRLLRLRSTKNLRSVVVTSAIQGEGKTLTSLNLALCCGQLHDMRVLLVDADVRSSGLSRAVDAPSTPGLADILSDGCKAEDAILATDLPNLSLLTSGTAKMPAAELFANRRWQEFVAWSNGAFGLTIVDCPPVLNLSDVEMITAGCDGVLMVVRALQTRRQILQKCAEQMDSKKLLGIVYNGAETASQYAYGYRSSGANSGR